MVTRRRFLGFSGVGLLAISTGCHPPDLQQSVYGADVSDDALQQKARLKRLKNRLLGYPVNMNTPSEDFFAWRKELFEAGIDAFAFNNVGNPFKESPIPYNTHEFERETIREFGKLFAFPADDTWGFLSHSGTDSNMHGMYMGRTLLKGRTGLLPKAYFTHESHYSVQILRDLLGLDVVMVETLPDGGMDPNDLADKLAENANVPALVVATVGTTFKGAIDNIDRIQEKLRSHASYLHVDAALFGGYLPFTPHAAEVSYRTSDNAVSGRYDSIAVSCHKFFGFPSPAGLFITKRSLYNEFNALFSKIHNPEYIHHVPGTITCSRDAVKPAEFYHFTTPSAQARQVKDAQLMLKNTAYLLAQMLTHFPELSATRANRLSNTVYFRNPGGAIVKKYSLATMHIDIDNKPEDFAHVVVMPHVSREVLTEFLTDLENSQSQ
ncbi:MAG: aminotransferase class V-fold PLP-dependent enzyme [Planctomycetaceae bacterium]|jgi:glutamate/tyrosine decarboxylase-like PLP-dependent enzyme|nr:aminotransferase class V-fold PLP-dependent enzyme [Planctomycetaceae bacterium]